MSTFPKTPPSEHRDAAASLEALTDTLDSECRLLEELLGLLQQQRAAVAADDLQRIEETVYSTHRVLHTLNEARRRRRSLFRMLGGTDELALNELEATLGPRMTDELRRARDDLEKSARALARGVQANRRLLRQAIAASENPLPPAA